MKDDFFDEAHVTHSLPAGSPGTIKLLKKYEFKGKLIRVRYYENKSTGEKRTTYEIVPETCGSEKE